MNFRPDEPLTPAAYAEIMNCEFQFILPGGYRALAYPARLRKVGLNDRADFALCGSRFVIDATQPALPRGRLVACVRRSRPANGQCFVVCAHGCHVRSTIAAEPACCRWERKYNLKNSKRVN